MQETNIAQYDGNVSISSNESESSALSDVCPIPVQMSTNKSQALQSSVSIPVHIPANKSQAMRIPAFIPVHVSANRSQVCRSSVLPDRGKPVRVTVRRNNLVIQAISLPVVMVINPRSIYKKSEEFSLLLEQYSADVICMSESFERENKPLQELLQLEKYEIINMVKRREFKGGNPAIVVNKEKYLDKKICPEPVTVPVGVEVIWAIISPRNNSSNLKILQLGRACSVLAVGVQAVDCWQ